MTTILILVSVYLALANLYERRKRRQLEELLADVLTMMELENQRQGLELEEQVLDRAVMAKMN